MLIKNATMKTRLFSETVWKGFVFTNGVGCSKKENE